MARRKKEGPVEAFVQIAGMLPWWVGVALAIVSYLVLHAYASAPLPNPANVKVGPQMLVGAVFRGVATAGQYLLPLFFLAGAVVSAMARARKQPQTTSVNEDSPKSGRVPALENANVDEDFYTLWGTVGSAAAPKADAWSLHLLRAIDWKRFEEVCAEYFRLCGFHATTQASGPDGGIDIKLYAPNDHAKLVNIVQCKKWTTPVGPKVIRELLGVMTASKLARGVFVTSSTFNAEATRFALDNGIHLLDGQQFLDKILARPAADQQRLLKAATAGDYLTPSCPSCGIKLVKRESRKNNSVFWGCANFPRCKVVLNRA